MAIVFIPPLIAVLEAKEKETGRKLTQQEVESIRDNATAIQLPEEIAGDLAQERGYSDVAAENVWDEWQKYQNIK
ncbi:hypothetical protein [Rouxiella sp. Mn2063]|uniref:hypothetical protein n=1 Tax=Rouxiella sp. Mn2063 TaxID=3395262 RepID=UPI003BCAFAF7